MSAAPKIPACFIKGKGLWEDKQCRLRSFAHSMQCTKWDMRMFNSGKGNYCVSPRRSIETSRKQELLHYRADHCTKQRSDYFVVIWRETLITSKQRKHRMRQWWRIFSVGDPRWLKLSVKLCSQRNPELGLPRKAARKKAGAAILTHQFS